MGEEGRSLGQNQLRTAVVVTEQHVLVVAEADRVPILKPLGLDELELRSIEARKHMKSTPRSSSLSASGDP
jgi:hypothetical protein